MKKMKIGVIRINPINLNSSFQDDSSSCRSRKRYLPLKKGIELLDDVSRGRCDNGRRHNEIEAQSDDSIKITHSQHVDTLSIHYFYTSVFFIIRDV